MADRDRTRRGALQSLLGDLGEVLPYSVRANGLAPTPGWYIRIPEPQLSTFASESNLWVARDGSLYAGIDMVHAAATIERIHALIEQRS